MEQRISSVLGLDIPDPDAARVPAVAGGCFSLGSNVPAALRGPAGGFIAALLLRPRIAEYASKEPANTEFLAGCFDFANNLGYAFLLENGDTLNVNVGDGILSTVLSAFRDYLALLWYDGAGNAALYVNGNEVDTGGAITYGTGPDNFGIGGTEEPSFLTTFSDDAWGAVNCHLGGFMVGDAYTPAAAAGYTNSPAVEQYAAVFSALDVVETPESPVPGADPEFPASIHRFSVRNGLPQLVDNGNETWVDEVAGTTLLRVGTEAEASVAAHEASWLPSDI